MTILVAQASIPTRHGEFACSVYAADGVEHLVLSMGDVTGNEPTLVRVHSECLTGDVFGSRRCDCGAQLDLALERIAREGRGVLIYLRGHEGRGIGLGQKIVAYSLQDEGLDTVEANLAQGLPADARDYGHAADVLRDMGVQRVRLITNNPAKTEQLTGYGIDVAERVPSLTPPTPENEFYLRTKTARMGHLIDEVSISA